MSRVPWRDGKVVSVETRDGVFALGQMLMSPYIMFFDAFHSCHDWPRIELKKTPTLFCTAVVRQFIAASNAQHLKKIESVQFKTYPRRWIDLGFESMAVYRTIWTGTPHEVSVVYLGDQGGMLIEEDIVAHRKPQKFIKQISADDHETIDNHEFNTLSFHPHLNERLYLCHLFGKNVDPKKDLVFERHLPLEYERYMQLIKVPDKVLANLKPGILQVDKPRGKKKTK